jgi:hypothetical protein
MRQSAEDVLAEAQARAAELTATAHEEAQRELAAAGEQTTWTQETVRSLLETAELEGDRIRSQGHHDAGEQVRRARLELGDVTRRLRQRLAEETEASQREADDLRQAAVEARESAEREAESVKARAESDADRIRNDANEAAAQIEERAAHRLEEAEHGARTLRTQVADEVLAKQHAADDELRRARAEGASVVAAAREEADELRAQARRTLEDARTEIALLARRRDGITAELGQLSGVIQALAVPTSNQSPTQQDPES